MDFFKRVKNFLIFLFMCCISIEMSETKSKHRFNIEKMEVWSNPEYSNLSLNFHNSTTDPSIDIDWYVFKEIQIIWFRAVLSFQTSIGKQELINHTMNPCEDLSGHGNVVTTVIFNEFKKYGNITSKKCPMQPGYYYAKKIWLSEDYFPTYMPQTMLNLIILTWTKINEETVTLTKSVFESRIVEREV